MEEKSKNTVKNSAGGRTRGLKPFKKGQSGNPNGRPLGKLNYETLRRLAIEKLARDNGKTPQEIDIEISANALLQARKGNFQFYKDDKDRTYGQATQKIVGDGNIIVTFDPAFKNVTPRKTKTDNTKS